MIANKKTKPSYQLGFGCSLINNLLAFRKVTRNLDFLGDIGSRVDWQTSGWRNDIGRAV